MAFPCYFRTGADGWFIGNDPARGPWSEHHCHAGPVAGLMVRAAEQLVGSEKVLTRLTADILRPVPLDGVQVKAETTRNTRTLSTTGITVTDRSGATCATATTMHLVRRDLDPVPTVQIPAPDFAEAEPGCRLLIGGLHDKPSFGQFTEMAYPQGAPLAPGPKTVWMKTPQLLEGEETSPLQSLCPLADCGNGISWNEAPGRLGFMNTDLTLQVHREPDSDWLASDALSHWHSNAIGMSQATLFDTKGPVATALQTLALHPMRR